MYRKLIRPLLFQFDSEGVHNTAMSLARLSSLPLFHLIQQTACGYREGRLETDFIGRKLSQPIGLAAGFDKDAIAIPFFKSLGFSLIELGSVTREPQPGNPRPRIFRCFSDRALINRMGFPSEGVEKFISNFDATKKFQLPETVGINIGKNKDTPLDQAASEYADCLSKLENRADYFVVNVSSPNTADLRKLQETERLREILLALNQSNTFKKPLFVKIAPDLSFSELDDILKVCIDLGVSGVVATNTTFSREGLKQKIDQQGGLSGTPLFKRSLKVVEHIHGSTEGKLAIIGVGGISSAHDVFSMLQAGASCVQVYTALIYQGPMLVRKWCRQLEKLMLKEGITKISQLQGMGLSR